MKDTLEAVLCLESSTGNADIWSHEVDEIEHALAGEELRVEESRNSLSCLKRFVLQKR